MIRKSNGIEAAAIVYLVTAKGEEIKDGSRLSSWVGSEGEILWDTKKENLLNKDRSEQLTCMSPCNPLISSMMITDTNKI